MVRGLDPRPGGAGAVDETGSSTSWRNRIIMTVPRRRTTVAATEKDQPTDGPHEAVIGGHPG